MTRTHQGRDAAGRGNRLRRLGAIAAVSGGVSMTIGFLSGLQLLAAVGIGALVLGQLCFVAGLLLSRKGG